MSKVNVEIGKKFGYLEVIALHNEHWRGSSWLCKCECGNEKVLNASHLLGTKNRSPTKSCGCRSKSRGGKVSKNLRLYNIWYGVIRRCYDEADPSYDRYGAIGIRVEDEWREDYEEFYGWANANGYKDDLTIDRINSEGDYGPRNCRWVDYYVQAQNRGILKNNTTGVTGVFLDRGKYRANIRRNDIQKHLGSYDTFEEARNARRQAELHFEKHGTIESL